MPKTRTSGKQPRHKTRHRGVYYRLDARGRKQYIVWFADSLGKGHTETLPAGATEKDALARQAELRGRRARGERIVPTRLTVSAALDAWWEESGKASVAPKTATTYKSHIEKHLKPHLGRIRLNELCADDVATMIADMQKANLKTWTIRGALSPLSRLVRYAIRKGWINTNPIRELETSERPKKDQKKMRILNQEEIERLLAAAISVRWRTLFALLVFTGARISEALALTWADVDFEAGIVTIVESKTDAGRDRKIVLMPALSSLLKKHKLASGYSRDDHCVFATATGTPLTARNTLRTLQTTLEAAKVSHATQHELRHTFASLLIGQGLDVTFVADQLGHANPQITLRTYAKLFDPSRRRDEAREKLQTAFGEMV